ncbi:MAG: hypothetical protein GC150_10250 [Rhizobiales bacterium]|nr:hypothetical protein [Hyphomicrobiales bacterium]
MRNWFGIAGNYGRSGSLAHAALLAGSLLLPAGLAEPVQAQQQSPATVEELPPTNAPDPRTGDANYERARQLLSAIDEVLRDVAGERQDARKLPSNDDFLVTPIWTETREDRDKRIRQLLDSALGIVTDVPIVDMQKTVEERRRNIRDIEEQIVALREKQLTAPKDSLLPGILADTVATLGEKIADLEARIQANHDDIAKSKVEIHSSLGAAGIEMSPEQLDLLLDSVLSSDLVKLVATFNAAKIIDEQLGQLVRASGDNVAAARKYFAMHAALFAMLVHAQDSLIGKIDTMYLPRLEAIEGDIKKTMRETRRLLAERNRPDQQRALESNLRSQEFARDVAAYYRRYLLQQREQLANARMKALRDLRIADNTYETVEASFQLRQLMKDAATSFEAIQQLEAPGFEQIFKDQELRREFENLTRKLDVPSS